MNLEIKKINSTQKFVYSLALFGRVGRGLEMHTESLYFSVFQLTRHLVNIKY